MKLFALALAYIAASTSAIDLVQDSGSAEPLLTQTGAVSIHTTNMERSDAELAQVGVQLYSDTMNSSWQTYVDRVLSKFDEVTGEFTITNICSGAAIYGHDGSLWASAG